MPTIHGASTAAIRYMREKSAALAVYWIYVARCNYENVAWPSLRGLEYSTGWSINVCREARKWLVEHHALEPVKDYVRPSWRKLPDAEKRKRLGLDKSEYYRPTGYIVFEGKKYPLLYDPSKARRRKRKADVTPDDTSTDVSPDDISAGVTSQPVQHVPGDTELDSIPQLDSIGSQVATTTTSKPVAVVVEPEPAANGMESTGQVFRAYEENIGLLTPVIVDSVKLALEDYPADWIVDAIKLATQKEKRFWAYVEGILKNWKRDGRDSSAAPQQPAPTRHKPTERRPADAPDFITQMVNGDLDEGDLDEEPVLKPRGLNHA